MSFSERLDKIVDAPFDLGAQAADFFIDAAVHTVKQINPIDALIESFKDNIMGMQSETGTGEKNVASALLGPEGIIGAPIGALPGVVRDPFSQLIWTPFMEGTQFLYKNFIDRPIGTLATVERMVASEIGGEDTDFFERLGNLGEQLIPGAGDSKLYNWSTYQQAWDVTQSRSAGQALALSIFHIDIMDPKALEEFKIGDSGDSQDVPITSESYASSQGERRSDGAGGNYENMVSRDRTLSDYLSDQVFELDFSEEEKKIAALIIGNISDSGYWEADLEDLCTEILVPRSWYKDLCTKILVPMSWC